MLNSPKTSSSFPTDLTDNERALGFVKTALPLLPGRTPVACLVLSIFSPYKLIKTVEPGGGASGQPCIATSSSPWDGQGIKLTGWSFIFA